MGFLFLVAGWIERKTRGGKSPANNPIVYSLSLAVYCTSWTYYGSIGKAASTGMLFLTIYLGPTLAFFLGWIILRRMVRLKNSQRITSIADFISSRYNRSQGLGAIVTLIAIIGMAPYIALQLKAVVATFEIVSITPESTWVGRHVGPIVVLLMILFTNMFGVRRLDPTERHPGMIFAIALESVIKLAAFLSAGIFVTYFIYDGFGDVFESIADVNFSTLMGIGGTESVSYVTWSTYIILAMSAIMFLPRQFHMSVVENYDEKHIRTAMWLFPLYMVLINIFVLPVAMGGLMMGFPVDVADTFLIYLPFYYSRKWLTLLVFIGGFSAATSMIMISSMTLSTMVTNHFLLPLIRWVPALSILKGHLLRCRWAAVAGIIIMGYAFEKSLGSSYMLVNMGMISFAAVLQFAPVIIGGLFWHRGNKVGAYLGLCAGFLIWVYTLLIPAFVKSGWLSDHLLQSGPWGLNFFNPEQLFGLAGLDPLSHSLFWSMFLNIGFYIIGSLVFTQSQAEQRQAARFVNILTEANAIDRMTDEKAWIEQPDKVNKIEALLKPYFNRRLVGSTIEQTLDRIGIRNKNQISIWELATFYGDIENHLAGAIGSAAARVAMGEKNLYTRREAKELSAVYGETLARLKITPNEMKRKIDYYEERNQLLDKHTRELKEKIHEKELEIQHRKRAEAERSELEVQLRQTQKMEAIGTLAGGIAHDFNNILGAILGYTELLQLKTTGNNDIASHLQKILEAGHRAKDLVKQILTFSRHKEQELKPVQINLIAREALKLLRASLPTTIDIRQHIDSTAWILGDPTQIHQILMNLCTNANHAMQKDGGVLEVHLSNENVSVQKDMRYPELKPGAYLKLTVNDNGCGMSPEIMNQIFDPFFTTKDKSEGTGMGLSLVHGIVQSHGGRIYAESVKGSGSRFDIFFPAIEAVAISENLSEKKIQKGTGHILFVDDEPFLVDLGKEILQTLGYEVTKSNSSTEALKIFKSHPHNFDIVITDMTMPKMAGDELAKNLISIRPDIPIIMCTGYSDAMTEKEALQLGIRAFIMKPLVIEELADVIRDVKN